MNPYYQPSNKMPLGGSLLLLVGGTVAAAILAVVYTYAEWYLPFVYLNFVLCLGFGFLLGGALALLVRLGKLRSPRTVGWLAAAVGLLAVYLQWAVYLTLLLNSETTGTGSSADTTTSFSSEVLLGLLVEPSIMGKAMGQLYEHGSWSLKGLTPSGIFLGIIWLLEALIIVGGAWIIASGQAEQPFSEASNEWAEEETLAHPVGFAQDPGATRTALEGGQFEHLTPYADQPGEDTFARVQLHRAPNDPACHYLTLQNVHRTLDKKGKPSENTTEVCKHLAISEATYRDLKTRLGQAPRTADLTD